MVFWSTYPLIHVIQSKLNRSSFKSLIFSKHDHKSPTGVEAIIITNAQQGYISDISAFIKANFGCPPRTPILDIPPTTLLGPRDFIVSVNDVDGNIIGCIRYHYMGIFTKQANDIFCVDCFCIKKAWRKRGVGDYLLTVLHNYANSQDIPYCMFLKEGPSLSIVHTSHYSSTYVYRKLGPNVHSKYVESLSVTSAYKLMDIMLELNPDTFIIRNLKSENQTWKLYRNGTHKILVCFQDTYQKKVENTGNKRMCWATAWIESSSVTDECREEASKQLSDLMYPKFDYVWMDKAWIGNDIAQWIDDGSFNWYLYQWVTNVDIKKNYCILN